MAGFARRAVAVVLPLTLLTLAAGSGSVVSLWSVAKPGRWVLLGVLFVLAAAQARPLRAVPAGWIAAAAFVALALESAAWSVEPRLTVERIATVGVVFATAALLARERELVLRGLLVGAVLVALAGLVVLPLAHHDAVLSATGGAGWRFQGLGQNPNTVPLLLAAAAPIALWWTLTRNALLGGAALVLFAGEIAFSGSRGSLVAAVGGTTVTALACLGSLRSRALAVGAIIATALACIGIAKLPQPASATTTSTPGATATVPPSKGINAETVFRQQDEIGFPPNGKYVPPSSLPRTVFGTSGRAESWHGAIEQGKQRPLAGYGFGTEEHVFVDRFFSYESGLVENGYIGLFLQVGLAGLGVFLAVLGLLAWGGVRAVRERRGGAAAAGIGVLAAAMLVELVQSGFLSVGNIAAAAIWLAVLPLALPERA